MHEEDYEQVLDGYRELIHSLFGMLLNRLDSTNTLITKMRLEAERRKFDESIKNMTEIGRKDR